MTLEPRTGPRCDRYPRHVNKTSLLALAAVLALAGCSSTKKSDTSDDSDASTRLKAAQDVMAKTAGYHVKLTSGQIVQCFIANAERRLQRYYR